MKTFLQIANTIALATDEDEINTLEGVALLNSTVRLKNWINDGYRYAFRKVFKSEFIKYEGRALVNGECVDLSQLMISKVDSLKIEGVALKLLPYSEFRELEKSYGVPKFGATFQGELYLSPIPDDSYFIDYMGTAEFCELVYNFDTPILDPQILVLYGIYEQRSYDKQFSDVGAYEAFRLYLNAYISTLSNTYLTAVNLKENIIKPEDYWD